MLGELCIVVNNKYSPLNRVTPFKHFYLIPPIFIIRKKNQKTSKLIQLLISVTFEIFLQIYPHKKL